MENDRAALAANPPTGGAMVDYAYNWLLAFFAGQAVVVSLMSAWLRTLSHSASLSRIFHGLAWGSAVTLAPVLIVLLIRVVLPNRRLWPTRLLNVGLLLVFPIGTALGVFGLAMVDKPPRQS